MFRVFSILSIVILFVSSCQKKADRSEWRGPNRDGIYTEANLLKEWPEKGPELLWSFEGLGYGHSSPAVANEKVYVNGMKDTISSAGTLFTFDLSGTLLWEKEYGPEFGLNFHGTRSTPVIVDEPNCSYGKAN